MHLLTLLSLGGILFIIGLSSFFLLYSYAYPTRKEIAPPMDAPPNTIGRVRLQIGVDNAIARLDLPDEEAEQLAGILCGRVDQWVKNVYESECLNRGNKPRRKYDKMVG